MTKRFPAIAADLASLPIDVCVLDGEVCILDEQGRPSREHAAASAESRRVFFVFDVVYDGRDLRALPIEQRRARLARTLDSRRESGVIVRASVVEGDAKRILRVACEAGLEGVIAKKLGTAYGQDWRMLGCHLGGRVQQVCKRPCRALSEWMSQASPSVIHGADWIPPA